MVRVTKTVFTGNLAEAKASASRAKASGIPSNSNSIFPCCTKATQYSTAPLPLPCLTSRGFLVIGLSGNNLIQSLPPRLTARAMVLGVNPDFKL